jgi:hypothetical protein
MTWVAVFMSQIGRVVRMGGGVPVLGERDCVPAIGKRGRLSGVDEPAQRLSGTGGRARRPSSNLSHVTMGLQRTCLSWR